MNKRRWHELYEEALAELKEEGLTNCETEAANLADERLQAEIEDAADARYQQKKDEGL